MVSDTGAPGANRFGFLAEMESAEAKDWLRAFLEGRDPPPRVGHSDTRPAADLVSALQGPGGAALRRRVGEQAADLLGDAIERALFAREDPATTDYVAALLGVLEWLPVPQRAGDVLLGLALSARLRGRESERGDLHLLALRALVANQKVPPLQTEEMASLWRRELPRLPYGPVAAQGLLRLHPEGLLAALPRAIAAWLAQDPTLSVTDLAFVLKRRLGEAAEAWAPLAAALRSEPVAATALQKAAEGMRWPERAPAIWDLLRRSADRSASGAGEPAPGGEGAILFQRRWGKEASGRDPALAGRVPMAMAA